MSIIIVGGGLSGLVSGNELLKSGNTDFKILEAREKSGGRIDTRFGIDFGAAWFQNYHTHLVELLEEFQLEKFDQYREGKSLLIYNSMASPHYFEMNPDEPSAQRISGGGKELINSLSKKLEKYIHLNTLVHSIHETGEKIKINTNSKDFYADKVILALPLKLSAEFDFNPPLPLETVSSMKDTHTWMSNSIKVGLTYKEPFWRKKGLSGTVISQISPVIELYDHTNSNATEFGLMGFVNESTRDETPENRKEQILSYLEKYLGNEVRHYMSYEEKDWSMDEFTSTKNNMPIYLHPTYGKPIIQKSYMNNKLYFSGTETSAEYGGYMEGAVMSGKKAAKKVLES